MRSSGTHRNIIFDVGGVLLHLSYAHAIRLVLPLCNPAKALHYQSLFTLVGRDPIIADYERGLVSRETFFDHFVERTGYRGTIEQFAEAWQSILSENQPMLDFAADLASRHATFLGTNTSELLSVPWMCARFPALSFFRDAAASYELGAVKPDRLFYERATAQFGVDPASCIFIDDRPENVEGARAFGLTAIRYRDAETCRADVFAVLEAAP